MKLACRYVFFACLMLAPVATQAQDSVRDTSQDAQLLHFLDRVTFGPAPGDIATVRRLGYNAYLEQQLDPASIKPSPELEARLQQLPITNASLTDIIIQYQPPQEDGKLTPEQRRAVNEKLNEVLQQMTETKILRAIASPAQLQEVMVDFWFNHFNVFVGKNADRFLISTYERDAIRPYALGKFRDLLGATAHHPAMLVYLDNWENTDPNSPLALRAATHGITLGINENYAREIMELHTLGIDGGYTQQDVTTLAHILTGWGLQRGRGWEGKATFFFDGERHNYANQYFLGQNIRGGDEREVEQVLNILAASPATAHHIAFQLAQYFVADEPPTTLVDRLAKTFSDSDGDITETLRTLFRSPEFWDTRYAHTKFKPPFRYLVSAMRALGGMPEGDMRLLQAAVAQMGEPLYRCQTPNGYSNTNDQWMNSDALIKRIDDAKGLSRYFGANGGENVWESQGQTWTQNTWTAVKNADPQIKPAMLLASPEFLYY